MRLTVQMDPGSSTQGQVVTAHNIIAGAPGTRFRVQTLVDPDRLLDEIDAIVHDNSVGEVVLLSIRHEDSETPALEVAPGQLFTFGREEGVLPEHGPWPRPTAPLFFDVYRFGPHDVELIETDLSGGHPGSAVRITATHLIRGEERIPVYTVQLPGHGEVICHRKAKEGSIERYVSID